MFDQDQEESPQISALAKLLSGYGRTDGPQNAGIVTPISGAAAIGPQRMAMPSQPAGQNVAPPVATGVGTIQAPAITRAMSPAITPAVNPATSGGNVVQPQGNQEEPDPYRIALPKPPTYSAPDMQRWQELEANVQKYRTPTDPNSPEAATHWYDRLLGGAVGFGRGYVHDPNAIQEGGAVTNRRYNAAEAQRGKNLEAAQGAEQSFRQENQLNDEAFRGNVEQFNSALAASREGREQQSASDRATSNEEKAKKYSNAVDPYTIRQDEKTGKYYGRTYGNPDKEVETAAPKGTLPQPKNYEETVVAWANEKDPARKAALQTAMQTMRDTELKKFEYQARANRQPGEKPATKQQFEKVADEKDTGFLKLQQQYKFVPEKGNVPGHYQDIKTGETIDQDEYEEQKQSIQDRYEHDIEALGASAQHVDVRQGSKKPNNNPTKTNNTPAGADISESTGRIPDAQNTTPQRQPRMQPGSTVNFDGKPQKVTEVRRNSKTGEHAYNIGGTWYTDSQLKPK